jgi:plastocyanin
MRTLSLIALLCALSILVAGCGDDDDSSGGSSGSGSDTTEKRSGGYSGGGGGGGGGKAQTLRISADPGGALVFDKTSLRAEPGRVTIVMANPSDLPHAVEIEGSGVEVAGDTVMKGGISKASADVKAGEFEYYCPVGNHKAAGMEGTLTVR